MVLDMAQCVMNYRRWRWTYVGETTRLAMRGNTLRAMVNGREVEIRYEENRRSRMNDYKAHAVYADNGKPVLSRDLFYMTAPKHLRA